MRFPLLRIAQIVVMSAAGALVLVAAIQTPAQNAAPASGQSPASPNPSALPTQPVPQPIPQNVEQPPMTQQPPLAPGQLPSSGTGQASAPQPSSQAPDQSQAKGQTLRRSAEEVIVPVTVKDSRGMLITDLRRDEFRIFEDGIEQEIVRFQQNPYPLSAVILLDNDLPSKTVGPVQNSLIAISAGFGPLDETAVVTFDRFQNTVLDFARSNDVLSTQLKRLQLGSYIPNAFGDGPLATSPSGPLINGRPQAGGVPMVNNSSSPDTKNIDDAVHYAGEMLRGRGPNRRKLIFLISDGNNSRRNTWTFDATVDLLLSTDVSVYAIVAGLNPLHLEGSRLVHYAVATGGDSYASSKQQDLERLYGEITEQARNEYTLGYVPQHRAGNHTYHSIEVRVRRPDVKILARQGYYTAAVR
jgi:VWFA-related protein